MFSNFIYLFYITIMLDLWKETKMVFCLMVVMLLLDFIYLSLIKNSYGSMVTNIQKSKMELNIYYAVVVYFILIVGIYYFIIKDRDKSNKSKSELSQRAGILGVVIYGTFDFTNLAVFSNYELGLGVLDTIWGGILFSLTTYFSLSIFD